MCFMSFQMSWGRLASEVTLDGDLREAHEV
jgi:hypothetical protein